MLQLSTAVFITLSVLLVVESRRCYWCGPMAEQVHRSRRAPPCDAPSPVDHLTTCEHDLMHCAVVATSPPYIESRLCVKIYQDECYSLFCNSTKTWKMTCPCRGDLCNGFITDRESEAFTYLAKLVKKASRIKRATIATPKFIGYREKTLTNVDDNDDNKILQLNENHSEEIALSTIESLPAITNNQNVQNDEVSAEKSEQDSSESNSMSNTANDAKMGTSDSQIVSNDAVKVSDEQDSSNNNSVSNTANDVKMGTSDSPIVTNDAVKVLAEQDSSYNNSVSNTPNDAKMGTSDSQIVTNDAVKVSAEQDSSNNSSVNVAKMGTSDSQIVTNDAVKMSTEQDSSNNNSVSNTPNDAKMGTSDSQIVTNDAVTQVTAHVSFENNIHIDSDMDMQSDEPVEPVDSVDEKEMVIQSTALANLQMDNNGDMKAARSMDTANLVTNNIHIDSDMDMQSDEPVEPVDSVDEKEIVIQSTALANPQMDNNGDMKAARSMDTANSVTNTLDISESSHATEAIKSAVIVDKPVALDIKPSGESPTAEANSQNISPTKKMEESTTKKIDLDEKTYKSPKEKAGLTEKIPEATITEPSYTSSTIGTFEMTTKSRKSDAVTIYVHFYNYISWMSLFFI